MFNFHCDKKTLRKSEVFSCLTLAVQQSPNVLLCDHHNKVNNPNDKTQTKQTNDESYDFSFHKSSDHSADPSCNWDNCKNKAYDVAQTKII